MGGKKSRNKGKNGELEWAKTLNEMGFEGSRRGCQYAGGWRSPDVVTPIKGVHFEVKRVESFQLYPSLEQAKNDSGAGVPVVAHRKNHKPWVVVVEADRLLELAAILTQTHESLKGTGETSE